MNTKRYVALAVAAQAFGAIPAALAGPLPGDFYAFANIGSSDSDFRTGVNDAVIDDDRSFEVGGGYAINRYLAIQGSYQDFGEPVAFAGCPPEVDCELQAIPEKVEIDGWSAALIGTVPIGQRFAAFGKLGVVAWDASARSPSLNDSGEDLIYGAGLRWEVSDRWGVDVAYEEVDLDIRSVKVGALFHF